MKETFVVNHNLSEWLVLHNWFEDAFIQDFAYDTEGKSLAFTLAYQTEGTCLANTPRTLRVFEFIAEGVSDQSNIDSFEWSIDHCMEGIDVFDTENIGFSMDISWPLAIECKQLTVIDKPNKVEMTKPWMSDTELFVSVKGRTLPTPSEWLDWFEGKGLKLGWRFYAGEEKAPDKLPVASYDGFYLQELTEIQQTIHGLFFKHCSQHTNSFRISVQRREFSEDAWKAFKEILLNFESIVVSCGNCEFNKAQWSESLNSLGN